jgi:choline-sulfatase
VADEEVCDTACHWLAARTPEDGPFALMVGFTLPHCPFVARADDYDRYVGRVPPPSIPRPAAGKEHPWLARWRRDCGIDEPDPADVVRARTAYYGLVTRTDALVGRVLDALDAAGLSETTLVVYTSDHGEQVGEHGHWWKNTFYEDAVGVPLILSWPGRLPEGARRSHVVNLVDVGATLIEAAGAPPLPASNGRSLISIARDPAAPWVNRTFSEYVTDAAAAWTGPETTRQRMVRDGPFKLWVMSGYRPLLFDLAADPHELSDLAGDPAFAAVRADLERLVFADWDPDAIARRVARRQAEKRILSAWAANTRPPLQFVRELKAEESWLDDQEAAG